ncbi:hypothetical protein CF326_g6474 [Tilletia indica]|nr:hypothetical protein CF326_g6474 [Tilletia indica]
MDVGSTSTASGFFSNRTGNNGYSNDEILSLLPAFSYSLPVQVLVTGINLSICFVILSHLLFTASYHYPLSKHNFILQFGGATFLIINLATELSIIFAHAQRQSRRYPFGFNYVAVQVPPNEDTWNFAQQFFFLLLRAITVLFVHLTHIQFLTLLFPSRLERRLILWMLGPLALIASGMQFGDFTSTDAQKTSDLLDTLQRISESTLTMLYTCALLIWGLAVNRGRAWRTDGGTAAFGTAACFLAVVNTSMAFLELRFDYLHWLPDLTWVVTASQSWLGYWWWVGAGMGIGEVEDRAARAMRKRKRAIRKQRREQSKQAAAAAAAAREKGSSSAASASGTAGGDSALGSLRRRLGFGAPGSQAGSGSGAAGTGITGAESNAGSANGSLPPARTSRTTRTGRRASGDIATNAGDVELQEVIVDSSGGIRRGSASGAPRTGTSPPQPQHHNAHFESALSVSGMTTGSGSSNPSSSPANFLTRGLRHLAEIQPAFVRARIDRLRREHAVAARRNAREQMDVVERIMGRNPQAGLYRAESRRGVVPTSTAAAGGRVSSSSSRLPAPVGLGAAASSRRHTRQSGSGGDGGGGGGNTGRISRPEAGESEPPDPGKDTATRGDTLNASGSGSVLGPSRRRTTSGREGAAVEAGWTDVEEEDEGVDDDDDDEQGRRGGGDESAGVGIAGPSASASAEPGPAASDRARQWVSGAVRRMRLKEQDTY